MRAQVCESVRLVIEGANLCLLWWCSLAFDLNLSVIIIPMKRNISNASSGRIRRSSCFFCGYFFVRYLVWFRIRWSSMLVTFFLFTINFAWNSFCGCSYLCLDAGFAIEHVEYCGRLCIIMGKRFTAPNPDNSRTRISAFLQDQS